MFSIQTHPKTLNLFACTKCLTRTLQQLDLHCERKMMRTVSTVTTPQVFMAPSLVRSEKHAHHSHNKRIDHLCNTIAGCSTLQHAPHARFHNRYVCRSNTMRAPWSSTTPPLYRHTHAHFTAAHVPSYPQRDSQRSTHGGGCSRGQCHQGM